MAIFRISTLFSFFVLTLFSFLAVAKSDIQRVITLSPNATELAYSAGLGNKLVGVSEASDYPESALKIETISNYQGMKLERILALKPDLVIAWIKGSFAREIQQLQKFGIQVEYTDINELDDIPKHILTLSQWADDPSIGQNNATDFKQQLAQLRHEYQNKAKVRYFLQISQKPIMSVSDPYWPTSIFKVCGGDNVLSSSTPYPQIGVEQVVHTSPQAIFTSDQSIHSIWENWQQIPAVRTKSLWSLNPDWLFRPTMRSLKAIKQVCQYFDQVRSYSNKAE